MCGIAGLAGLRVDRDRIDAMLRAQAHRGPDDRGVFVDPRGTIGLGTTRLSVFDCSNTGHQPMTSADGRLVMAFNGAIYNYIELRGELAGYPFRGTSDTEVLLAAFSRWGLGCLDRLRGMFAFAVWDTHARRLVCARDRFGVKPLSYHLQPGTGEFSFSSEIKGLSAGGIALMPDLDSWRQYLAFGLYDHSDRTFFHEVKSLPAGHTLSWEDGRIHIAPWYDLAATTMARFPDTRAAHVIADEYLALMEESVRLRLRADVPVGITVSGGLDSAMLLALVRRAQGPHAPVSAFTFSTGHERYDETPYARAIVGATQHAWRECRLHVEEIPTMAAALAKAEEGPFGGVPTIAYANLFREARQDGTIVLLDGQGMDEQWAGYDYYHELREDAAPVQGSAGSNSRRDLLSPDFFDADRHRPDVSVEPTQHSLLSARLRDIMMTKLPRVLRFNDRASMLHSVELREPFLDHRLVELALALPASHLVRGSERKVLLRRIAARLLATPLHEAPKRPVQTPQREWLADDLAPWVLSRVNESDRYRSWFRPGAIETVLDDLRERRTDSSFPVWQMLSVALSDDGPGPTG